MKRVINLLRQAKAASKRLMKDSCGVEDTHWNETTNLDAAIKEVEAMSLNNELVVLKRLRK